MDFKFDIDLSGLQKKFELSEKQMAFASVNAINKTAIQIQEQARVNIKQRFVLRGGRGSEVVLREAAIIKPFASVGRSVPFANIFVGQKDRLLLSAFERGATRRPFVGSSVAVPITGSPARPSFNSAVPANMRFQSLGLQPAMSQDQRHDLKQIKGGNAKETRRLRRAYKSSIDTNVWRGKQRTYMIKGLGVFQRFGKGKRDTTMLYKFVKNPTLHPRLGFLNMAMTQGKAWLRNNLDDEIKSALLRKR